MHVRWLELVGFRNCASLTFAPDPNLNVLLGRNGQGKTSLLEGLHLLLTGRSFRTTRLGDCVGWDAAGQAAVAGEVVDDGPGRRVRIELHERAGGVEVRGTLCPWARAVSFSAGDLALLTGSPQGRRAYLDGAAAKLTPVHAETCRRYRLAVQQRTRLLGDLAGRADAERLLAPWDVQVATLGSEILHRRIEVLRALGEQVSAIHRQLAPGGDDVTLGYLPTVPLGADTGATEQALLGALHRARADEIRRGIAVVGPHKDDVSVRLGRADARHHASRGEQRLLALTLRLGEAAAVRRRLGTGPVFVLDDVLSELDVEARHRVLAWLARQGQVVFSATDAVPEARAAGTAWEVRSGEVVTLGARARGAA